MAEKGFTHSGCFAILIMFVTGPMCCIALMVLGSFQPKPPQPDAHGRFDDHVEKPVTAPKPDVRIAKVVDEHPEVEYIPGLTAANAYEPFTTEGFQLSHHVEPAFIDSGYTFPEQWIWTCRKKADGHEMEVEIVGASPTQITEVSAMYSNYSSDATATNQHGRQFLVSVASIPYLGSEPSTTEKWVEEQLGKKSRLTVSGITFELAANAPRVRALLIHRTGEAEATTIETERAIREKEAATKLNLAKQLLNKNKQAGKFQLLVIIEKYHGTAAAKEAKEILDGK